MIAVGLLIAVALLLAIWLGAYSDRMQRRDKAARKQRWQEFRRANQQSIDEEDI